MHVIHVLEDVVFIALCVAAVVGLLFGLWVYFTVDGK